MNKPNVFLKRSAAVVAYQYIDQSYPKTQFNLSILYQQNPMLFGIKLTRWLDLKLNINKSSLFIQFNIN